MAETLSTFSIISFVVAGVCLVLAVLFWFIFKIPTVIGDLTGRTARKSIAKMRAANEKTGVKSYKESKVNVERGKPTGSIPNVDTKKAVNSTTKQVETSLLTDNKADKIENEETGDLDKMTDLLAEEETLPLNMAAHKKMEIIEEIILIHTNEVI